MKEAATHALLLLITLFDVSVRSRGGENTAGARDEGGDGGTDLIKVDLISRSQRY